MKPGSSKPVVLGLGSNLGDRLAHLRAGVRRMSQVLEASRCSSVYASRAQGVDSPQPDYLNAVLVGRTELTPEELLGLAQEAENDAGRERPYPDAPRTLDVDILFYGDEIVRREGLRIPHPRWRVRAFVLVPLSQVAPDWRDPEGGRTVLEVLRHCSSGLPPVQEVAPPSALLEIQDPT